MNVALATHVPDDYDIPEPSKEFQVKHPKEYEIYRRFQQTRAYNYAGAKIPLDTHLNLPFLDTQVHGQAGKEVLAWLRYGFTVGLDFSLPSHPNTDQFDHPEWKKKPDLNHGTATNHPDHVNRHIEKELDAQTLFGPFEGKPFTYIHLAALMSRDKSSSIWKRIIEDFKFPIGYALNSMVSDLYYLNRQHALALPSPLDLSKLILKKGRGCLLASFDFKSAFRQIKTDVSTYPWVNFKWQGKIYSDNCVVYGMKDAMLIQQLVSNTIAHVLHIDGHVVIIYCDDGAVVIDPGELGKAQFNKVLNKLKQMGFRLSEEKTSWPSHILIWIGIVFNSLLMTMSVPKEKIDLTLKLVNKWSGVREATLLEWQRLSGKLHYVSSCSPGARHFLGRIYDKVSEATVKGSAPVTPEVQKDLYWFSNFLEVYNGKRFIRDDTVHHTIFTDACLTGGGAEMNGRALAFLIPLGIKQVSNSINQLEAYVLLVALRKWTDYLRHKNILIRCDNQVTVHALQSGKSREPMLRAIAREIWHLTAANDIDITISYINTKDNVVADTLSRTWLNNKTYSQSENLISANNLVVDSLTWTDLRMPNYNF